MKDEFTVEQEITLEGPKLACILLRNNSGALNDENGRPVRYGLGNISKQHNKVMKSSDRIGFTMVMITPEMVGKTVAVFTAGEIKKEGWRYNPKKDDEVAQKAFIDWVIAHGGHAGFWQSVQDFKNSVASFMSNLRR